MQPKTKQYIIIGLTVIIVSIVAALGVALALGNLDGKDIVNIIEAFKGVFSRDIPKITS